MTTPPEKLTLRQRALAAWATTCASHPFITLLICLALAAGSVFYTLENLAFKSERADLIAPDLDWQQRYAQYREHFPRWEDAVVVIDRAQHPEDADRFADALAPRIEQLPEVIEATWRINHEALDPALIYNASPEELRQLTLALSPAADFFAPPDLLSFLTSITRPAPYMPQDAREHITTLLRTINPLDEVQDPLDPLLNPEPERFTTPSGDLAFIFVQLNTAGDGSVDARASGVAGIRDAIAKTKADPTLAHVQLGVTGIPVLESDETTQSTQDATLASILSALLIALLMLLVYRALSIPLIAMLALLVGVAWSFAWVTLAVGHLQILSVVFAVILLGLGIDVALHLIARLELVHPDHDHMPAALARTYKGVGPGIITAALTTACAFAATALTDFAGVAEMGLIAAGGVILCTIAVLTVLPAALSILPKPENRLRAREGGEGKPSMGALGRALFKHPALFATLALAVTAGAIYAARAVQYNPDLLALMPPDAESVKWEHRLTYENNRSGWHAVVAVDSIERAYELHNQLETNPVVASVGGITDALPDPASIQPKRDYINSLSPVPLETPAPDSLNEDSLRAALTNLADEVYEVDAQLAAAARALATSLMADLVVANQAYVQRRALIAQLITDLRAAEPPTLATLPKKLRDQLVGIDNSLLVRIYPAPPEDESSILAKPNLVPFAEAVLAAAPNATGPAIQIYASTELIQGAYADALLYAAIAIALLLLIDFRNPIDALCAFTPVLLGSIWLLGIMGALGIDLNFANTIVMPLIVGIGVDAGVHAVHRWKLQPHDPPAGLAGGTGRAITLTSLTTAIGFACMTTAHHQGIKSLGLVMTIGLATTWAAALFALPPLLRLRSRLAHATTQSKNPAKQAA